MAGHQARGANNADHLDRQRLILSLQTLVTGHDFGNSMRKLQGLVERHADKKGHLERALQT